MIDNKNNSFSEVDPSNVSESWKKQREVLFLRQNIFVHWETLTSNSLTISVTTIFSSSESSI